MSDVLNVYKDKPEYHQELSRMVAGYDLNDASKKVPIAIYNQMCDWIENNISKVNTKKLGRQIGKTAFDGMVAYKLTSPSPTPNELMQGLVTVAQQMIQDPKKHG